MAEVGSVSGYRDEPDRIPDSEVLYRRIHSDYILWDRRVGGEPPPLSKSAFRDLPQERAYELGFPGRALSVHLASVVESQGREPTELLPDSSYGLVSFTARDVRAHGQGVQYCPTGEDESHAVVFSLDSPNRSQSQEKRVRDAAQWVVVPPDPHQ